MRKSNVLIVDDAPSVHTMVEMALKNERLSVHSAYDGRNALTQAAEIRPSVILLDVDLPHIDGLEVCRRLKASQGTRQASIIFLTADLSLQDKVKAFELGAVDYITKPFRPEELRARVQAAVRSQKDHDLESQYAMMDRLTKLFNRRYFESRLDGELARARRSGQSLGCILIDVDDMHRINQLLDRDEADEVLVKVAQGILHACRREDVVCRFGGDEFAVLAIGMKADAWEVLAERIQQEIQSVTAVGSEESFPITASIGVALSRFSTGLSVVVEAAEALEQAQRAGGNRIVIGRELVELRLAG